MSFKIDFVQRLPKEVVIDCIFPYINPNSTSVISTYWRKLTSECENKYLPLVAKAVLKDPDFEQLATHEISSSAKELSICVQKGDSSNAMIKKIKEVVFFFIQKAKQAPDYAHFSKTLHLHSPYSLCYLQLLRKHYEHRQLLKAMNFLHLKEFKLPPEEVNEVLNFAFPMTSEQQKKVEKMAYLGLGFILDIRSMSSEAESDFDAFKRQVSNKVQSYIGRVIDFINKNAKEFIPDPSIKVESLSHREVLLIGLSRFRNPKRPEESSDDRFSIFYQVFALVHHLNLIRK
jgi:hypothetical protein